MADQPIVEKHAQISDPAVQSAVIQEGAGNYSHEDELPLKMLTKRAGWFGRRISVTTTEEVWYRDAITRIVVPAGFTYDLASIPRPLWVLIAPWDIALESLFHDLLYRKQEIKRRQADQTLLSMMQDRGVPWHVRWAVYLSVRWFGWKAWRQRHAEMVCAAKEAAKVAAETGEPVEMPSAVAPDKREQL
jgi:hypothetical protein